MSSDRERGWEWVVEMGKEVEELGGMVGLHHTGVQGATGLGLLQPLLINTHYHITLSSYVCLSVSPLNHEFMGA